LPKEKSAGIKAKEISVLNINRAALGEQFNKKISNFPKKGNAGKKA
jgi:hypothetical protein